MPRIRVVELYQVIGDDGSLYQQFFSREDAEDYLTDLLEGLADIQRDEQQASQDEKRCK